jgi:parvulin-like peptidyl-prolyl isomerase
MADPEKVEEFAEFLGNIAQKISEIPPDEEEYSPGDYEKAYELQKKSGQKFSNDISKAAGVFSDPAKFEQLKSSGNDAETFKNLLVQNGLFTEEEFRVYTELLVKEKAGGLITGVLVLIIGVLAAALSVKLKIIYLRFFLGIIGIMTVVAGIILIVLKLNKPEYINNHAINSIKSGDLIRAKILLDDAVAKGRANEKTYRLIQYVNSRFEVQA